jgi:hypothetical protein
MKPAKTITGMADFKEMGANEGAHANDGTLYENWNAVWAKQDTTKEAT